jgi:Ran GTPase-activating protein (RanGAP) involved in mRNA processing and transport
MSDADSDADSISNPSNAHISDDEDGAEASSISPAVRELCDRLRANDPRVLNSDSVFVPFEDQHESVEGEQIAVFQALNENISMKQIRLWSHKFTKRSAETAAHYLESSKTLQALHLRYGANYQELPEVMSLLYQALSRNTSVTELSIDTGCASVAFQELLTSTQTLQTISVVHYYFGDQEVNELQTAAITLGFANNTTLRDLEFRGCPEADLAPVMTALRDHPALQKILFRPTGYSSCLPALSGLEILLRSQDSKVKELVLQQVGTRTVGLHVVIRELGRNTTVTNLFIRYSELSRENNQQLKSMLRQNTALESLDLAADFIGSAGLAEIAPVLYHNTSIKALDLTNNSLHDSESSNALRELIRRNKTITSLCIALNAFGRNTAAVRSIAEGVRSNTTLQQLDLSRCGLDDQGILLLADALVTRNATLLELDLCNNQITSLGVRALVDDNMEALKTLTKPSLSSNRIRSEGATILADALGRNDMSNLKRLDLNGCGIDADGVIAMVSTLEQNTSLQILNLRGNDFGERGYMALAESLPNIKGLQQIDFASGANEGFQSVLPLLLEGFRENTSLVKVVISVRARGEWS